jgi:hypothetical protein
VVLRGVPAATETAGQPLTRLIKYEAFNPTSLRFISRSQNNDRVNAAEQVVNLVSEHLDHGVQKQPSTTVSQ